MKNSTSPTPLIRRRSARQKRCQSVLETRGLELTTLTSNFSRTALLQDNSIMAERVGLEPNVKDEPRRELARRVPHSELDSDSSFRSSFGRTRRDSSRRWLWRLVRLFWFHRVDDNRTVAIAFAIRANNQQRTTAATNGHFIALVASELSRSERTPAPTTATVAMITAAPTTTLAKSNRFSFAA